MIDSTQNQVVESEKEIYDQDGEMVDYFTDTDDEDSEGIGETILLVAIGVVVLVAMGVLVYLHVGG